jgi:hypothetical protein
MLDLRSDARRRLLAYYFTNPAARHHLRDLAEWLSTDPSNLSKELRRLEREGLFRSEISGRQKYFQLNREYPLFDEMRGIVGKTIGAAAITERPSRKLRESMRQCCTVRLQKTNKMPQVTSTCWSLAPRLTKPWRKPCESLSGN